MDFKAAVQVGFRPLYLQVREELTRYLTNGRWQPGAMLPSEQELARELGVSQGTVRKALDAMTAESILVRRQGRGTFVPELEEGRIMFQFFRLYPDKGERLFPVSKVLSSQLARSAMAEAAALDLKKGITVWRINRLRYHGERIMLRETISLSADRFPGFGELAVIPNNVYRLYSERWGVSIVKIAEKLKAVAASPADAVELGCKEGTPLLRIERVAYDLNKTPVEFRVSHCLTETMHYASNLS
ncbi:MAG TPA: GntR family transcriptional regulator [Rhizobiaceae bacterium]|nr:GntR family transcriptional regulator [Rhizobiaceae bacterium]